MVRTSVGFNAGNRLLVPAVPEDSLRASRGQRAVTRTVTGASEVGLTSRNRPRSR